LIQCWLFEQSEHQRDELHILISFAWQLLAHLAVHIFILIIARDFDLA